MRRWSSTTSIRPTRSRFLRELGRVARIGIVVNDLGRSRITLLGAWLLSRITTRNALQPA